MDEAPLGQLLMDEPAPGQLPMDPALLEPAVEQMLSAYAKKDPKLQSIVFRELMKDVGDCLGVTPEQMEPMRDEVKRITQALIDGVMADARKAASTNTAPTSYQRAVTIIPWHTLTVGMQDNISQARHPVRVGRRLGGVAWDGDPNASGHIAT